MKKIVMYVVSVIQARPVGFLTICLLTVMNLIFAAGLYAVASFIISLAALHPTYDQMMIPVVSVRLFGVGRAVLSYGERYYSHNNTFHILKDLRLRLYDKMLPILPDYETRRADQLVSLISDIELLQEGILRLVYPLFSALMIFFVGTSIAFFVAPVLGIIFALIYSIDAFVFPGLLFFINSHKISNIDSSKQALYEELLELKEGISEIASYGRETEWLGRMEHTLNQMNGDRRDYQKVIACCEAGILFLQGFSNLLLLYVASNLVVQKEMSGVELSAVVLGLITLITEVMLPGQTYFKFQGIKRAAETVFGNNKKTDKYNIQNKENNQTVENAKMCFNNAELKLNKIRFHYPSKQDILKDFSMALRPGELIAIVGESGGGKSTLIHLILGFLNVNSGNIQMNGVDSDHFTEEEWLRFFSVVDQKPFFFHQTIEENLQLAKVDATEEEMYAVLKAVALDSQLVSLEKGLKTPVFEWGANFSGGEIKRLTIARALLKDCPFYIFDEPTADLDATNEKLVLDLLFSLAQTKGVLLITHRPHMLEKCNEIIYI